MVKTITQETFENAVQENMELFEMSLEEAIQETTQQFEAQGVDLSNILKDLTVCEGKDELESSLKKFMNKFLCEAKKIEAGSNDLSILDQFITECSKSLANKMYIGKHGGYEALIHILKKRRNSIEVASKTLETIIALMTEYPDLLDEEGITLMMELLNQSNTTLKTLTFKWIRVCCLKHEQNRQNIFSAGILDCLKTILSDPESNNAETIKDICSVFRALVLDDDVRVEYGHAYIHAKHIASDTLCPLVELLEEYKTNDSVVGDLMLTLAALLVRSEYCKQVQDTGAIDFVIDGLLTFIQNEKIIRQALKLLKALAGNDDCKFYIVGKGAAPIITAVIDKYKENRNMVTVGFNCVAALCLRAPDNSTEFYKAGIPDLLVECMQLHQDSAEVQKRASWVIRNMVSRNKEQNKYFISIGVEEELNKALDKFSDVCEFDIKSALRDLGCQVNLKEQWTGKGGKIHTDEKKIQSS